MNKFKLIALEKNYTARALQLFTGAVGDISHALATVSRFEATALVEAMPEGKIAERLVALADYIDEVEGTLADPILTFVSKTKTDEDVQMRLDDDILAIIKVASDVKLERVLRYFADTYLELRESEKESDEKTVVSEQQKQKIGEIKVERNDDKKTITITVHPTTYSQFVAIARREIENQEESQIDPDERLLVDYIKFTILEKVIYALFHSIQTNERLVDAKVRLGMILSEQLDPSLVTDQDVAAAPQEAQDLAKALREKGEEQAQRKEVKERTKLAAKAKDAQAAWLAEHPELAGEFEEMDKVDKEIEEGREDMEGFHEEEEHVPLDEDEAARTETPRGPAKKPGKDKAKKVGLDFEDPDK